MRLALSQNPWAPRLATALLWAGVAGCTAFWVLTRPGADRGDGDQSVALNAPVASELGLRALLGATGQTEAPAARPATSTIYALEGVLAGTESDDGAVLLGVNGQRPKTYRIGSRIDGGDDLVLLSVRGRQAFFGPQPGEAPTLTLDVPAFKPAAPPPGAAGGPPGMAPANAGHFQVPAGLQRAPD